MRFASTPHPISPRRAPALAVWRVIERGSIARGLIALAVLGAALSACAGDRGRILNPEVPRNPVIYESNWARDTFEDAVQDRWDDGRAKLPGGAGTLSSNAYFNREVVSADLDGDGILSEIEAQQYDDG
jgi:hypothetical protein